MRAFVHRWFACASASLLLTMAACAGGCGGKVTLRSWQSAVESYVLEEGNGDVGVLRNVTIAGGQRGFAVLGKAKAADSSDAAGLLVASRQVGGRNWYIYLLGLVRKGDVVEMRLVALGVPVAGAARAGDDSEEGFVWAVGQADEVGFGHYVDYHEHAWESRHGGRAMPPPYRTFPRPGDVFDVVLTGLNVEVVHVPSGARWDLALPAASSGFNSDGG